MYFLLLLFTLGLFFESMVLANPILTKPSARNKRMIGGINSKIKEFPYLVALELNSSVSLHCGGAIISPSHILTAAHCLIHDNDINSYLVRAGSSFTDENGSEYKLRSFTIHENYNGISNDLAVLRLKNPIKFDRLKQPIVMFEFGEDVKNESIAKTAGWGVAELEEDHELRPTQLQSIELKIVDKKTCNDTFTREMDGYGIRDGQICASDFSGHQSACDGDSGGPLVVDGRLAGISFMGLARCTSWPVPNVFTEVAYFRNWIDKTVMKLSSFREKNLLKIVGRRTVN